MHKFHMKKKYFVVCVGECRILQKRKDKRNGHDEIEIEFFIKSKVDKKQFLKLNRIIISDRLLFCK